MKTFYRKLIASLLLFLLLGFWISLLVAPPSLVPLIMKIAGVECGIILVILLAGGIYWIWKQ